MASQNKRRAETDAEINNDDNEEYETLKQHDTKRRRENKKKKYQHILEEGRSSGATKMEEDDDDEGDTYGEEGDDYAQDYEIEQMAAQKEGIQLEPFNMKQELEEGSFDDYGNYVRKKDKSLDDPWYDAWQEEQDSKKEESASKEDDGVKKVFLNTTKGSSKAAQKKEEYEPVVDLEQNKKTIVNILHPNETVLQGLRRLKPPAPSAKGKTAAKGKAGERVATGGGFNIELFNKLTEAADNALASGYYNIYSDSREKIEQSIVAETPPSTTSTAAEATSEVTEASTDSGKKEVMWEYKTDQASTEIHGPFSTSAMIAWKKEGYFQGDSAVWVRRIGSTGTNFYRSDRVDFEDYLDE
eukprot:TRINITY_DN3428_c0_g1_i1.p1 TRINITY_DN3428_c0_g1~~TRINITY_DN3428_c0_g1_i1.p1  ORF type:complete len:387 (+),score=140.46 TRINITY_DN3428_c0_g1_i1:95-1162(+)